MLNSLQTLVAELFPLCHICASNPHNLDMDKTACGQKRDWAVRVIREWDEGLR